MRKVDYNRRLEMAKSTETGILKKLANDPYEEVRATVARNPSTPEDIFRHLARYEGCLQVLEAMLENPSTPEDIREKLNEKIRRYSEGVVN